MSLVEKIRRAREQRVEAGGLAFIVRRPTDLEMIEMRGQQDPRRFLRFLVGWDRVRELDVIPGGGPQPVPFDAEVAAEWLADRPDLFGPIVRAALESYEKHSEELEAAAGKSEGG